MTLYLASLGFLAGLLALSLYLSRSFWPHHAGGARGYVTDTLIYNLAPVAPMLAALIIFVVLQSLSPDADQTPVRYVLMGLGVVGIFLIRRLPVIAAANARMREAREARFDAIYGASRGTDQ